MTSILHDVFFDPSEIRLINMSVNLLAMTCSFTNNKPFLFVAFILKVHAIFSR